MNRESTTLPGAVWMLGSFALGAIAMFLSDPEQGRRRRAMASERLQSAADSTSKYVSAATQDMGSRAQDLRAMATEKMHSAADTAGKYISSATQDIGQRAQDLGQDLGSRAQDLGSRAQDMGSRARELGAGMSGMHQPSFSQSYDRSSLSSDRDLEALVNRELWMLGGVALGALAMFLADPQMGRRRRALANDKFRSAANKTRKYVESTSRDLSNRAQGMRAEADRMLRTTTGDERSSDSGTIH